MSWSSRGRMLLGKGRSISGTCSGICQGRLKLCIRFITARSFRLIYCCRLFLSNPMAGGPSNHENGPSWVKVTVTKPLLTGRQVFRLRFNGYVNFLTEEPNPMTIRASLPLPRVLFLCVGTYAMRHALCAMPFSNSIFVRGRIRS